MFRVIIAGSRNFTDYKLLKESLDYLLQNKTDITIISGTANGADKLGEKYADEKGYPVLRFPADWDKYGKKAGYIRNLEMANNADAAVIFCVNESKGASMMYEIALSKGLPIRLFNL